MGKCQANAVVAYGHFCLAQDPPATSPDSSKLPLTGENISSPNDSGVGGLKSDSKSSHTTITSSDIRGKGSVHPSDKNGGHSPIFTIGNSYLESDVKALTKTFADHSKPLYKSHAQTGWVPDHATVSLTLTESQTENDLISMEAMAALTPKSNSQDIAESPFVHQVMSFSPSSWHYGWRSSKHMRKSFHVFSVYVFAISSSSAGTILNCIGHAMTSKFTLASSKRSKSKAHTLTRIGVKRKSNGASASASGKATKNGPKKVGTGKTAKSTPSISAAESASSLRKRMPGHVGNNISGRSRAASEAASSLLSITSNMSRSAKKMSKSPVLSGPQIPSGYSGGDSRGSSASGSGSTSSASSSYGASSSNSGSSGTSSSSNSSGVSSSNVTSSDSDVSNSDESASKARDGSTKSKKSKKKTKKNPKSNSKKGGSYSATKDGTAHPGLSKKRRPKRQTSSMNQKPRKSAKISKSGMPRGKSDVGAAVSGLLSMLSDT